VTPSGLSGLVTGYGPTADDDQCFGRGALCRRLRDGLGARPDAESVDLNRENVECQFEASKLTAAAGLDGVAAEQRRAELEVLCMEAKGWSRW
jgi:hypothetical protein